jgi:hypothetical protein
VSEGISLITRSNIASTIPGCQSKLENSSHIRLDELDRIKAVLLGECASVDEMTIGFQGSHKDKRRITYKAEGDGLQWDALCQEGYCYQHYFRNDPAPKKYIALGLSPLHARVM